jgi:hypothetical protein
VDNTKVTAVIQNSKDNNLERQLNTIGKDHWEFSFTPAQAARYEIVMHVEGKQIDGSPLNEIIKADQFYFPDEATVLAAEQPKSEAAAASSAASKPAAVQAEAEPESASGNLWLYISIGVGNLLVLVLGYVAYRLIAGKGDKDELDEIEKTLATDAGSLKKTTGKKMAIDVSDDGQMGGLSIGDSPISNNSVPEMTLPDDLMADNLFPLDNLDDSSSDKK